MSSSSPSSTSDAFNPQAPLIGPDGYEYSCFADWILGERADNWRNNHIRHARRNHVPEEKIRAWHVAFDSWNPADDNGTDDNGRRLARHICANFAVDPSGRGLSGEYVARDGTSWLSRPEGNGRADPGQAPADPVHAAD